VYGIVGIEELLVGMAVEDVDGGELCLKVSGGDPTTANVGGGDPTSANVGGGVVI